MTTRYARRHSPKFRALCNNCTTYYRDETSLEVLLDDRPLESIEESYEYYRACPRCKTDSFLTHLNKK